MKQIKIFLSDLELKTFTEQNALDYCFLNNINPDNIIVLILDYNNLTDISGIKLFKNTERLWLAYNNTQIDISVLKDLNNIKDLDLSNNKITDISVIKNLKNLMILNISNNEIEDISVLKNLKKLKKLILYNNQITDISVIKNLNNLEFLDIDYLKLESDQIKYLNSCKNLKELWCNKGFKDMSVLDKLNDNIRVIK